MVPPNEQMPDPYDAHPNDGNSQSPDIPPQPPVPPPQPPVPPPPSSEPPWGAGPNPYAEKSYAEKQQLQRQVVRHRQARQVTILDKFVQGVMYLVGALQILLGLRFLLRLTAANPENTFAEVIYGLSDPFVTPFSTLFISPTFNGSRHIFDLNILVAMAAYLALLGLLLGLIQIFRDT